jgi:hypothetical protein
LQKHHYQPVDVMAVRVQPVQLWQDQRAHWSKLVAIKLA